MQRVKVGWEESSALSARHLGGQPTSPPWLGSARLRSPPAGAGAGAGAFLTWGRQQHAGRAALEAAQQGRGPDAGVEARHGAAQLGAA